MRVYVCTPTKSPTGTQFTQKAAVDEFVDRIRGLLAAGSAVTSCSDSVTPTRAPGAAACTLSTAIRCACPTTAVASSSLAPGKNGQNSSSVTPKALAANAIEAANSPVCDSGSRPLAASSTGALASLIVHTHDTRSPSRAITTAA